MGWFFNIKWLDTFQTDLIDTIKKTSVRMVCHCPVLPCKRYNIWGSIFLRPEDLEKVRVGSLLSLVASTWLGLVS
jgi:hypothetical protein